MPSKPIPEPWLSFLSDIDASLHEDVQLHCRGGSVMTMLYGLDRPTSDVDVLPVASDKTIQNIMELAGEGSWLHKKHHVYLQIVGVATVPIDYDTRLTEMFPGSFTRLRLYALDPYDLALTKLERNTQRDRDDIKHLARTIPFDLELLERRYHSELRRYLANPEREDMTLKFCLVIA